ncbi:hypothetical protein B0T17DRAFT_617946 [Bombardia bombarda]|uniref:Uncharacterized protein n=1 Tax=Bombardia bombarda TaxID=252184 RepID=A0AA39WTU6_9PEZI|nr:hypothetical protein B0T17DRAFT_617946 [Bombardia bombarda]
MSTPFTEDEKRMVLVEMIKASHVDLEWLVHFINYANIVPDWGCMQVPLGRNLNQCYSAATEMLSRPVPRLNLPPLKRGPTNDRDEYVPTIQSSYLARSHAPPPQTYGGSMPPSNPGGQLANIQPRPDGYVPPTAATRETSPARKKIAATGAKRRGRPPKNEMQPRQSGQRYLPPITAAPAPMASSPAAPALSRSPVLGQGGLQHQYSLSAYNQPGSASEGGRETSRQPAANDRQFTPDSIPRTMSQPQGPPILEPNPGRSDERGPTWQRGRDQSQTTQSSAAVAAGAGAGTGAPNPQGQRQQQQTSSSSSSSSIPSMPAAPGPTYATPASIQRSERPQEQQQDRRKGKQQVSSPSSSSIPSMPAAPRPTYATVASIQRSERPRVPPGPPPGSSWGQQQDRRKGRQHVSFRDRSLESVAPQGFPPPVRRTLGSLPRSETTAELLAIPDGAEAPVAAENKSSRGRQRETMTTTTTELELTDGQLYPDDENGKFSRGIAALMEKKDREERGRGDGGGGPTTTSTTTSTTESRAGTDARNRKDKDFTG